MEALTGAELLMADWMQMHPREKQTFLCLKNTRAINFVPLMQPSGKARNSRLGIATFPYSVLLCTSHLVFVVGHILCASLLVLNFQFFH